MKSLNGSLLFNKECEEILLENVKDFDVYEMNQAMITDTDDHFERFFNMAKNLTEHKYGAARILCGCRDLFSFKSSEISGLRTIIKNLISGLYNAAWVRNNHELEILKRYWETYRFANCKGELTPLEQHQKIIFTEFCKVETLIDIRLFAEFLKKYIITLVFELIELSLSQLDSTIAYWQSLNYFEYFCTTAVRRYPYYIRQFRKVKLYDQLMSS